MRINIIKAVVVNFLICFVLIDATYAQMARLTIHLHHSVGKEKLKLEKGNYTNDLGQAYTVTKFKYYIGKIKLEGINGNSYNGDAYYLVDEEDPDTKTIVLDKVTAGEYSAMSFIIGVDSANNCSGAQSGDLDPVKGMFWTWNTGYIFLKLEGRSPASAEPGHFFELHIGGYKAPANCIRQVQHTFKKPLVIKEGRKNKLDINADVAEILKTPVDIDFCKYATVTDFHNATMVADNYADMFSIMENDR